MRRIYHPWHRWECVDAGLFATVGPGGLSADECLDAYAEFLRDAVRFDVALGRVVREWPISCEQFLTNEKSNRIAWLGQASMCIDTGIPSVFRGGFKRLAAREQARANAQAGECMRGWLVKQSSDNGALRLGEEACSKAQRPCTSRGARSLVAQYVDVWSERGYPEDIPDEVPSRLMDLGIAPSYKAVAVAILRNDIGLSALGFSRPVSKWYGALKRIEIAGRSGTAESRQLSLW